LKAGIKQGYLASKDKIIFLILAVVNIIYEIKDSFSEEFFFNFSC
jgi:hypothetical protein